jgi:hypothetical protein
MALSPLSPAAAAPAQPYMANENTPVQAEAAVRVTASSEALNKRHDERLYFRRTEKPSRQQARTSRESPRRD